MEENFDPVVSVLNDVVRFGGGIFAVMHQLPSSPAETFVHMIGKGKGMNNATVMTAPRGSSVGIPEAMHNGLIILVKETPPRFNEFTGEFEQHMHGIYIVSFAGYQRITLQDKQSELTNEAQALSKNLINSLPDQFSFDQALHSFPRDEFGLALAYAIFRNWVRCGLNGGFYVTADGKLQRST